MTKTFKKFAAVIVVASLLVSCFCFGGSAIDSSFGGTPTGNEAMSIGLTASADSVEPGDVVTFTVRLSNNYNAITMFWPILYSTDFFELVDGSVTSPIDNVTVAAGTTTTTTDSGFIPSAYAATHSVIGIQWVAGGTADGGVAVFNSGVAADCFTVQLKVKDTATGTGTVLIPADYDGYYYSGVSDPSDPLTYYNSATPFNFTFADAVSFRIGGAYVEPELVAADGYSVKLVTFDDDESGNEYLIGFDPVAIFDEGGNFTDQFEVQNGTYTVSTDMFATGTVVTVYDSTGAEYAEYEIIMFGDTNGDGVVDGADIGDMSDMYNYAVEFTGARYYAADIFADDASSAYIDTADIDLASNLYTYAATMSLDMQLHNP